jgi:hypothetical protein
MMADPSHPVLKLPWDSKKPASSDFTLGKRTKSPGAISGKQGGWWIALKPFTAKGFWTEAAVLTLCLVPIQKTVLDDNPGLFSLKTSKT